MQIRWHKIEELRATRPDLIIGENVLIAKDGVHIGRGTVIMNNVEIRPNTNIGTDCYIDSQVCISGNCSIGDNTTLRYGVIIARGCKIGNDCYLCPRVMTNNLDTAGGSIGGAVVSDGCFVGTHTVLHHGIFIAANTTIGSNSFVNKDIEQEGTKWVGSPARQIG